MASNKTADKCSLPKSQKIFFLIFLTAYSALHIFLLLRHEAWRDEAQAWTIAVNASLPELFADLCTEGHPALWFLFIRIFAKLGLPYSCFGFLSFGLMTASAGLLLFRAPMPTAVKLCIVCSSLFCYFNPVITRIYSLVVLLVVLLAVYWPVKYERPVLYGVLIALLFQSHIIMAGLAGGLLLCMGIHLLRKGGRTFRQLAGVLIGFSGMCLTFLELYQRSSSTVYLNVSASSVLGSISVYSLCGKTLDLVIRLLPFLANVPPLFLLLIIFSLVVALVILSAKVVSAEGTPEALTVLLCGAGFAAVLLTLIYSGTYQMALCLILCLVFTLWVICREAGSRAVKAAFMTAVSLLCVLTVPAWIQAASRDIREEYSGSKSMSTYIAHELPPDSTVFVCYDCYVPSVCAYVRDNRDDIRFYNIDTGSEFSFHVWGQEYPQISVEDICSAADSSGCDNTFFLIGESHIDPVSGRITELCSTPGSTIANEEFTLYKIN